MFEGKVINNLCLLEVGVAKYLRLQKNSYARAQPEISIYVYFLEDDDILYIHINFQNHPPE